MRTRRDYSPEFKEEAVRLVIEHGLSVSQVADDLGINRSNINRWVRLHRQQGDNLPAADADELHRLRKELARVKMERDILKKAVGIFTQTGT